MEKIQILLRIFKGDVRHLPRIVVLTILSISIYNFGWGFADPFFSVYLSEFSEHYTVIGFYRSLATFAGVIVLIPLGSLLDRIHHNKLINAAKFGYFFVALFYFVAGEFNSILLLIIALVVNGALGSIVWAGTAATIREQAPKKDAGLAFGLYVTARQLAYAGGLLIAIMLLMRFPIHYIFIPVMIFPLLSMLADRGQTDKHTQSINGALKDMIVKDRLVLRFWREMKSFNLEMWMMYILYFLAYSLPLLAFAFLPLFAFENGHSLTEVGFLVLVMNVPFIFSLVAAEIADHSGRLRNIIIGMGVSAVALALLSIYSTSPVWLFICAFFIVAGYSLVLPSLSSVITVLTPKKYIGTGSAMVDITIFSSAVILAPLIGLLIDEFDWSMSFLIIGIFAGVVVIITAGMQILFKKRNMLYHVNHPDSKNDPYII